MGRARERVRESEGECESSRVVFPPQLVAVAVAAAVVSGLMASLMHKSKANDDCIFMHTHPDFPDSRLPPPPPLWAIYQLSFRNSHLAFRKFAILNFD